MKTILHTFHYYTLAQNYHANVHVKFTPCAHITPIHITITPVKHSRITANHITTYYYTYTYAHIEILHSSHIQILLPGTRL